MGKEHYPIGEGIEEARKTLKMEILGGECLVILDSEANKTDCCYLCRGRDNKESVLVEIRLLINGLLVTSRYRVHSGCYEGLVNRRAKDALSPSRQ